MRVRRLQRDSGRQTAQLGYRARINPTETGAREVTIQVPAGVVYEVGTNLPNVASETVTVSTNLDESTMGC